MDSELGDGGRGLEVGIGVGGRLRAELAGWLAVQYTSIAQDLQILAPETEIPQLPAYEWLP